MRKFFGFGPKDSSNQGNGSEQSSDTSFGPQLGIDTKNANKIVFYCLGDYGNVTTEVRNTASAMNEYALENGSPDFIVGLGDNFYPYGPDSADDKAFDSVWRNQFLKPYPALQVPWRMVLGNHDYYGNPQAQVDYHYHKRNRDRLWYMPSRFYSISMKGDDASAVAADFYIMDTNAVEIDLAKDDPTLIPGLQRQIQLLDDNLTQTASLPTIPWRIAFAHHPLYTAGWGHGRSGQRLRSTQPTEWFGATFPGFDMESVFAKHRLDGYFAGHEHVFQFHEEAGVPHFCCGNSGAEIRPGDGLYQGKDDSLDLNWVARGDEYGFVAVELTAQTMTVRFVQHDGEIIREFVRTK